jgi:hypothetical protein
MNYIPFMVLDDRTVFHAPTAAVFRIEEDGTPSTLFDKLVPQGTA